MNDRLTCLCYVHKKMSAKKTFYSLSALLSSSSPSKSSSEAPSDRQRPDRSPLRHGSPLNSPPSSRRRLILDRDPDHSVDGQLSTCSTVAPFVAPAEHVKSSKRSRRCHSRAGILCSIEDGQERASVRVASIAIDQRLATISSSLESLRLNQERLERLEAVSAETKRQCRSL